MKDPADLVSLKDLAEAQVYRTLALKFLKLQIYLPLEPWELVTKRPIVAFKGLDVHRLILMMMQE